MDYKGRVSPNQRSVVCYVRGDAHAKPSHSVLNPPQVNKGEDLQYTLRMASRAVADARTTHADLPNHCRMMPKSLTHGRA